jgi:hypothetical protein
MTQSIIDEASSFMRVAIAVTACLLMGIIISFLALSPGSGPAYQGRTARQWVHIWFSGYSGQSPHSTRAEMDDAERAIRAMGTNIIPYAVMLISKKYPSFLKPLYVNAEGAGYTILEILGTNARPATPALIKLTKDPGPTVRDQALGMLVDMDLDEETILPVMLSMSHDPVPWLRAVSIQKFLTRYPDEAKRQGFTWEALDADNLRRARSGR